MKMKSVIGVLLIWLLLPLGKGYGQTAEDLKLSSGSELVDGEILLCHNGEPPFECELKNETAEDLFSRFKLRLGDGREEDMSTPGKTKWVTYNKKGSYTLEFVGIKPDGSEVVKSYLLKIVGEANARLERESEQAKCIGSDVKYTIKILSEDSDGTRYFLNYDDGSPEDFLEYSKISNREGVFVHRYNRSYCDMDEHERFFKVTLKYQNECYRGELTSVNEKVVVPFHAAYTFDNWGGEVCTYQKIQLRNLTSGGTNTECSWVKPRAFWDFGNGMTSDEWEPEVLYEEVGPNTKIKLVVRNQYSCATDSVEMPVSLINRVEAIMEVEKDEVCVG
ncbi:MAG: hypothetical protein K2L23_01445, partial [Odoribacter sp.]|nr:hypothetical protein [Odoribacter sp.]